MVSEQEAIPVMVAFLRKRGWTVQEPPHKFLSGYGQERMAYYGDDGQQPWDIMIKLGWAADFAAGSILKYLRRSKGDPQGDLDKARIYLTWLNELAEHRSYARGNLENLRRTLTEEEWKNVTGT